jgi:hypothetical protein
VSHCEQCDIKLAILNLLAKGEVEIFLNAQGDQVLRLVVPPAPPAPRPAGERVP